MTRLPQGLTSSAVLRLLDETGPLEWHAVNAAASAMVGTKAGGVMALHRMQQAGLLACEYRITRKGRKAMRGSE